MSGELEKRYRRISKKCGSDRITCRKETVEYAIGSFKMVPEEMAKEIISFFVSEDNEIENDIQKLDDFLDLLHGNELGDNTLLEDKDWVFIKDIVNEFANSENFSIDIVTDIMKVIVDKGLV